MAKRKRTDEEQKLYDQLEALRETRREAVAERDAAFALLDECATRDIERNDMSLRAERYIIARKRVLECDSAIATQKAEYDAMRARNDNGAQS